MEDMGEMGVQEGEGSTPLLGHLMAEGALDLA